MPKRFTTVKRFIALPLFLASPAWSEVGVVVEVINGQIVRNGETVEIEAGSLVEEGDILTTTESGVIQIRMNDNTRFVVGDSTTISIDTALIGGDQNVFEQLAVGVTSGAFRMFSGNSDSEAYEINTPNATMGIRGTTINGAYEPPPVDRTIQVVTQDTAFLCLRGRDAQGNPGARIVSTCTVNDGQCSALLTNETEVGEPPDDFPYEVVSVLYYSQDSLNEDFRDFGPGCEGLDQGQPAPWDAEETGAEEENQEEEGEEENTEEEEPEADDAEEEDAQLDLDPQSFPEGPLLPYQLPQDWFNFNNQPQPFIQQSQPFIRRTGPVNQNWYPAPSFSTFSSFSSSLISSSSSASKDKKAKIEDPPDSVSPE